MQLQPGARAVQLTARGSYYLLSLQQPDAATPGYRRKS